MSNPAPYPNSGRPFTFTAGAPAQLLTEYAVGNPPLILVNTATDQTDRIWVGSDSSVGPDNGVPLDAGTALPWTGTGVVYAVADSAAASTIVVYITSAISGWTPSPAAIAAETAVELEATGVPNVLVEKVLVSADVLAVNGYTELDVTDYASVTLVFEADTGGTTGAIALGQSADGVGGWGDDYCINNSPAGGAYSVQLATVGDVLTIENKTNNPVTLYVVGTNRPPLIHLDARQNFTKGDHWHLPNQALTANETVSLTQADSTVMLQGPCYLAVTNSNKSVTGRVLLLAASGVGYGLMDSAQMVAASNGQAFGSAMVAVPAGDYVVQFQCQVAGTTQVWVDLIPAAL